jgi:hypothetical protein
LFIALLAFSLVELMHCFSGKFLNRPLLPQKRRIKASERREM